MIDLGDSEERYHVFDVVVGGGGGAVMYSSHGGQFLRQIIEGGLTLGLNGLLRCQTSDGAGQA